MIVSVTETVMASATSGSKALASLCLHAKAAGGHSCWVPSLAFSEKPTTAMSEQNPWTTH